MRRERIGEPRAHIEGRGGGVGRRVFIIMVHGLRLVVGAGQARVRALPRRCESRYMWHLRVPQRAHGVGGALRGGRRSGKRTEIWTGQKKKV